MEDNRCLLCHLVNMTDGGCKLHRDPETCYCFVKWEDGRGKSTEDEQRGDETEKAV